jgi:glycosyltransferase involved in cell wall biosynthesis
VSASTAGPEVSIIVESYNHGEGSSLGRLRASLVAAIGTAADYGPAEVLLADSSGDPEVERMLTDGLRTVRRVEATGLPYDEAKSRAIAESEGDYVLFLDGDVIPDAADWASRHVAALRKGAAATSGLTRYEGGFLQKLLTVLDFGFLLPAREREVRCYASNNAGFRRESLEACPIPTGPLRCECYYHADLLRRRGTPARMVPDAAGTHERQPFWEERVQRGHDQVAACWVNPELPERRLLKLGPLAAPLFLGRDIALDLRRLWRGRRDLGLGRAQAVAGTLLLPLLRLPDLVGIVRALLTPPRRRGRARATTPGPSPSAPPAR